MFTPDDPDVWFQQVEWALEDVGITTSQGKFRQVAKSLDGKYSKEVRDLIINPPAERPYEKLKEELLERLGKSKEQKIRRLLEREEIGDKTPSQFLRHLRQFAGTNATDTILKTMWMDQLNPLVRAAVAAQAAQPDVTLDTLARTADGVTVALGAIPPKHVSAVSAESESQLCAVLERLTLRLDEQHRELNELRAEVRGRSQNRGRFNKRGRSHSRSRNRYGGKCFYHYRFGAQAHRCEQPCSYVAGDGVNSGNAMGNR